MYYFMLDDEDENQKNHIYKDILYKISELLIEINTNNIHEIFYIYCYLLWNGYFSIDKKYGYSSKDPIDELTTIFLGSGCCRHNSNLLRDVLKISNIDSKSISIRINKTKLDNIMNIKQNIIYNKKVTIPKQVENHKVVLVNEHMVEYNIAGVLTEGNNSFILDPTMLTECEVLKHGKLYCFNGLYKINLSLLKERMQDNYLVPCYYNKYVTLDKKKLISYYDNAHKLCEENKQLMNDFYCDNYPNYEKVKSLVLK